jgi:hypothetical protein
VARAGRAGRRETILVASQDSARRILELADVCSVATDRLPAALWPADVLDGDIIEIDARSPSEERYMNSFMPAKVKPVVAFSVFESLDIRLGTITATTVGGCAAPFPSTIERKWLLFFRASKGMVRGQRTRRPATRYYSLTRDGRRQLSAELAQWRRTSRAINLVLEATIS